MVVPYVLLAGETNQQPSEQARFFIYGGVFFPAAAIPDLHDLVRAVRADAGYQRTGEFKFDTRSRPQHVTRLDQEDESGICLVERLPYRHGHQSLGEIFRRGLKMPNNRYRVLNRVPGRRPDRGAQEPPPRDRGIA